jgi:hypothetical protein
MAAHGAGWGDPLDGVVVVGDDRPLVPDPKVDPAAAARLLGHAGCVSDDGGDRHEQPAATTLLGEGHRQDLRPALGEEALQAPGVLLGP